jgi:hypothetical protein
VLKNSARQSQHADEACLGSGDTRTSEYEPEGGESVKHTRKGTDAAGVERSTETKVPFVASEARSYTRLSFALWIVEYL